MRAPLAGLVAAALVIPSTGMAQRNPEPIHGRWAVGATLGASSFSGATEGAGPAGEPIAFAPYRPTMWGLVIAYGGDGLRVGLSVEHGQPGIGFRGVRLTENGETLPGFLIVAEDAFKLTTVTAGLSQRLLRLRGGPSLRPSVGLVIERWSAPGSPGRTIAGAQGGVALEVKISRAFSAELAGELGFTPASPFHAMDLPEGFRQRSTWRRTLAVGLSWRFGK